MSIRTDRPEAAPRITEHAPEPEAAPGRSHRLVWVWPALLTAAVVGHRMTAPQPWRDELATWSAATRTPGQLWQLAGTIDAVAFPYYLFMHAWIGVFGDSVLALRLPSVLAMTATAAVVTQLGRRLYGVPAGLVAGLLFAVVPSVSRYGQEARAYAFATLFAALATLLLVRALEGPSRRYRAGYGVVVLLLGSAHLIALLILAGHAVAVAGAGRRAGPRRVLWWPVTVGAVGLCLAPLALLGLAQRQTQLGWLAAADWRKLETLPDQLFGSGVVGGAVIALAAAGMCAARRDALPDRSRPADPLPDRSRPTDPLPDRSRPTDALPDRRRGAARPGSAARWGWGWRPQRSCRVPAPGRAVTRHELSVLWPSVVLPIAALFAVDQLIAPIFVGRYLLFVVPLLCVLAGAALAGTPLASTSVAGTSLAGTPLAGTPLAGPAPSAAVRSLPALLVVLAVGLAGLPQQEAVRRSHEAPGTALYDYRRVADFLREHQRPGDGIVYAPRAGWHFIDVAMRYHLRERVPRDVLLDRDAVRRGSLWATECPEPAGCLAGTGRVWVLSADDLVTGKRAGALDGTTAATRAALGAYAKAGEWRLSEFTLALYTR